MADGDCVFCAIIAGKVPSAKVMEDDKSFAFLDINPRNPGHTLVIPKKHYETVMDMPESEAGKLFEFVKKISVAVRDATKADGISIGQSNNRAAGQVVPHVHFHVIPRFNSESPPSLESVLGVKKMPEEVMIKIANTIKSSMPSSQTAAPKPAPKKKDEFDF